MKQTTYFLELTCHACPHRWHEEFTLAEGETRPSPKCPKCQSGKVSWVQHTRVIDDVPNGLIDEEGRGPAIVLSSGKPFHVLDPRPEEIELEDIAHALSNLCRFTGHCLQFYSVAQHSVEVSKLLLPGDDKWGLLHDASEAYIGDLARPVKHLLRRDGPSLYDKIEAGLVDAIGKRFGLPSYAIVAEDIKQADDMMLSVERKTLMHGDIEWFGLPDPGTKRVVGCDPVVAYFMFMDRARELGLRGT